jgi:hypothetical protein
VGWLGQGQAFAFFSLSTFTRATEKAMSSKHSSSSINVPSTCPGLRFQEHLSRCPSICGLSAFFYLGTAVVGIFGSCNSWDGESRESYDEPLSRLSCCPLGRSCELKAECLALSAIYLWSAHGGVKYVAKHVTRGFMKFPGCFQISFLSY